MGFQTIVTCTVLALVTAVFNRPSTAQERPELSIRSPNAFWLHDEDRNCFPLDVAGRETGVW